MSKERINNLVLLELSEVLVALAQNSLAPHPPATLGVACEMLGKTQARIARDLLGQDAERFQTRGELQTRVDQLLAEATNATRRATQAEGVLTEALRFLRLFADTDQRLDDAEERKFRAFLTTHEPPLAEEPADGTE